MNNDDIKQSNHFNSSQLLVRLSIEAAFFVGFSLVFH